MLMSFKKAISRVLREKGQADKKLYGPPAPEGLLKDTLMQI